MRRFIPILVALAVPAAAEAKSLIGFASPSHNIGCYMDTSQVRCDIRKRDWKPPKKPASCPVDYGQGAFITKNGTRGQFVCAGDTALDKQTVLPFGYSILGPTIKCKSSKSGIRCVNGAGHGFKLSRQKVSLVLIPG